MIFVVLGTQKFPMTRLLSQMDDWLDACTEPVTVLAQSGHTEYTPRNFTCQPFMDSAEFEKTIADCDLLITHSGVGTIMTGLKYTKPIIIAPRLAVYGEHVDDHQLEIAKAFAQQGYVLLCDAETSLPELIGQAAAFPFRPYQSNREHAIAAVRDYLATL